MMHDLLSFDLKGWHPRQDVPKNASLREQQLRSLPAEDQWWLALLDQGILPRGGHSEFHSNARSAPSAELFDSARKSALTLRAEPITGWADISEGGAAEACKGKGLGAGNFPPLSRSEKGLGCFPAWNRMGRQRRLAA